MINSRTLAFLVLAGLFPSLLPGGETGPSFTEENRNWWAVQPVRDPEIPAGGGREDHPIDAFTGVKLAEKGLSRAPKASPGEFVRRAFFDLHGLPPEPAQVEAFEKAWAEDEEAAVEKLVDELLESPRYGERWAQHWFDVVRFAESDGYREDRFRFDAFRYRDYVIQAFNEDKPYDEFVREQLAADEIAPDDPERLIATGFLRHGIYEWNQRNAEMQQELIIHEMTRVTGEVFLALGIGCAQCHDHKFDPILQEDYYALQAFLSSTFWPDDRVLATPRELAEWRKKNEFWEEGCADILAEIEEMVSSVPEKFAEARLNSFPENVQAMYRKPASERTPYEKQICLLVDRQLVRAREQNALPANVRKTGTPERKAYKKLLDRLEQYDAIKPRPLPPAFIATDVSSEAVPVYLGEGAKKREIAPGVLALLGEELPEAEATESSTGRRSVLANWIASADNPFTARVMVNRIWQYHFGRGLVATANDFGTLGEAPSHPELLDWLASRFVEGGWKMKPLHRLLMTSETYRQTARREPGAVEESADPLNRFLWRFPPQRLSAEQVRDAMLAVSGELEHRGAGPSVKGFNPVRSVYVWKVRNTPEPMMQCFDSPAGFESAPERQITTTPTQSLMLTNNEWPLARAGAFARRVAGGKETIEREDIREACRLAWGREAVTEEVESAYEFLADRFRIESKTEVKPKYDGETGLRPVAQKFGDVPELELGENALWLQPGSPFESLELTGVKIEPLSFTVEAVLSLDKIHSDGRVNVIASQWNGDQSRRGWTFGITSAKSRYQPRNLIVQLNGPNPGGDLEYEVVASGLRVPLNEPVYVAAVVECRPGGKGTVKFFLKELSKKGDVQSVDVPHNISGELITMGVPFLLGGRSDRKGHDFDGQIARFRCTKGAVARESLMLESPDPQANGSDFIFAGGTDETPAAGSRWIGQRKEEADGPSGPVLEAFTDFCHALLSSNEFLYLH